MTDLITLPRATVQQALEALENCTSEHGHRCSRCDSEVDEGGRVIAALKAALEQPDQGGKTGWPPGLLQDDCRGLSKWLASQPDARRRVREAAAALEQPTECRWLQDGDEESDTWAASCGRHRYFQLNEGTPTENRMTHCCYCGKPLVEVPIEPEDNHD